MRTIFIVLMLGQSVFASRGPFPIENKEYAELPITLREGKTSPCRLSQPLHARQDPKTNIEIIKVLVGIAHKDDLEAKKCAIYGMGAFESFNPKSAADSIIYLERSVLPILLSGLEGPDLDLAWQSAYSLTKIHNIRDKSVSALLKRLRDSSIITRIHAAQSLHDMGLAQIELVPVYIEMLELDKIRYGTRSLTGADGLLKIGSPAKTAIPHLVKALTNSNVESETRARSAWALWVIDPSSDNAASGLLDAYGRKGENDWVRCKIVEALSKMKVQKKSIRALFEHDRSSAEGCSKQFMNEFLSSNQ